MANLDHGGYLNDTTTAINMLVLAVQMLAHDARRPFNLLRVVIGKLKRANSLNEMHTVCDQMLPQIERSIAHVEAMVQDILDYGKARSSVGNQEISLVHLMESVVRQCVELTPASSQTRQAIKCTYHIRHLMTGDEHKLQRAFSNIIGNALEASANHGKVWITVNEVGPEFEIRVANSGSFIEPKDRERIFDSFFTAGKTRGTGLGLAIAREVLEAHGGSIECSSRLDSEFPSGITEFICRLPVSLKLDPLVPAPITGTFDSRKAPLLQILLVEDDPYIAQEWIDHFDGRMIVHVIDQPELLRLKLQSHPDFFSTLTLVVMDLYFNSSEVDGLTLAAEIRRQWPQLPIYLSSDFAGSLDAKTTILSGRIDKLPSTLDRYAPPIITM